MKRILSLTPIIVFAALIAVSTFVLLRAPPHQTVTEGRLGRPVPAYDLSRLGGGAPVSSSAYMGRRYLINVFASWCVPCRAEVDTLMALKREGVVIIGVAYKDRPEDTQAFLQAYGNPYDAIALDPDGRFGLDLGRAGIPETFVIDPEGHIRLVIRSPLTPDIVDLQVRPALSESS